MISALLALALAAPARPTWREADAIAAFRQGSPALAEARAAEAEARGDLEQAGLHPNPTLSLGASNLPLRANVTPSGNGGGLARNLVTTVGLDQPLELGGKRGRRVAAARGAVDEAALGVDDALRTAGFEVRRAFWHAVRARDRRALAEQVSRRMAETVRIMRARFESQDLSGLDLDKVELEAARTDNDLDDARAEERASIQELLARVGPGAPADVELAGDLATAAPAVDPARLAARALEERPDLRAARRHVETTRSALALAEAQAAPDLDVGVGWSHSRAILAGDNPDALAVTLSLPIPLFHRNQGEIARARAALAQAERARDALAAEIGREVAAADARYGAAVEKVARYDQGALQRVDHALEVAERTYRSGDTSLLEFLEAERTYAALRGDYLDTLFELREAALGLERAAGAPLAEERS